MTWVQYKSSCDISQCIVFPIEWRFVSTCILNHYVCVMTCLHRFRISFQFSIFVHSYERKFLILVTQCSDKKFENVNRWTFASGWKPKRKLSSRTYIHKIQGWSTYDFNIKNRKIHFNHEPRGEIWDINVWTSGNFSCLGRVTNGARLFQDRDICC